MPRQSPSLQLLKVELGREMPIFEHNKPWNCSINFKLLRNLCRAVQCPLHWQAFDISDKVSWWEMVAIATIMVVVPFKNEGESLGQMIHEIWVLSKPIIIDGGDGKFIKLVIQVGVLLIASPYTNGKKWYEKASLWTGVVWMCRLCICDRFVRSVPHAIWNTLLHLRLASIVTLTATKWYLL